MKQAMRVEALTAENQDEYQRYVAGRRDSLLYHSLGYLRFLEALLGCDNGTLIARSRSCDQVKGVFPLMLLNTPYGRVINSLPYYGSNGGILADDAETANALRDFYIGMVRHPGTIAATVISNPLCGDDWCDSLPHTHRDYRIGQLTPLANTRDPWNELMERFASSARRNVRKAIKEGVAVEVDNQAFSMLQAIHYENMQAIGGLPKSPQFFELVPRHFKAGEEFDLYVARVNGELVAGLLLFYFNRTVEYFTPVIRQEWRSTQPLALIVIEAMADASKNGFEWWNWGGTWPSQEGVYRFKEKWATQDRRYEYYTQLNDSEIRRWTREDLLARFPNFYVLPFSALEEEEE